MVESFWLLLDGILAWLLTPPMWATVAALVVMTGTYVLVLLGDERLVRFMASIRSKERRVAEFKKVADDETVKAFAGALAAQRAIYKIDWSPTKFPPLPKQDDRTSTMDPYELASDWEACYGLPDSRLDTFQFEMCGIHTTEKLERLLSDMRERVRQAQKDAVENTQDWHLHEDGRLFSHEMLRRKWHWYRSGSAEVDAIFSEVRTCLEHVSKRWEATPNADAVHQLLQGIEIEKPR